jgi:hypothetical protein
MLYVMSDFFLKKWYVDAADNQGNVFIGYWVSLRWRKITLHGYQLLQRLPKGDIQTQGGFTKQPEPFLENDHRLVWQPKNLKSSWESSDNTIREVFFESDRGNITWQCVQPKAKAKIQLPDISFEGAGYTECIEITIPIWDLPLKTLYWGRAHSENHYVTWIKWDGTTKQSIVWFDGKRSNDLEITNDVIYSSHFQLQVGDNISLREGKLASTVFKPFAKIVALFPKSTFLAEEHKWFSQGTLTANSIFEPATIIYEKVIW